jgi:hypothetical protein
MNTMELFRYPLLPLGAEFSLERLKQRGDNILKELILKIPSLNQTHFYITYDFKVLSDGMWIVVKANDFQLALDISKDFPTLSEFERMVIRDIKNIPFLLNMTALRELADETFENKTTQVSIVRDPLKKVLKVKRGKKEKYEYRGQLQLVIHPNSIAKIPDSRVRTIKCMVREKLRFHAVIDQVSDITVVGAIKPNKKFKLNLNNFMDNDSFHNFIGPYMRKVESIDLTVQAFLDGATGEVDEYLLLEY